MLLLACVCGGRYVVVWFQGQQSADSSVFAMARSGYRADAP